MSTGSQLINELIGTCQANADDIAQAFARAFDVSLEASVGLGTNWDSAASPEGFSGPGLAVVIHVEQRGLVAALPQTSGLLPEWVNRSDASSKSRLETLAQELSLLLLPDSLVPGNFRTVWVDCLAEALERAAPADGAARIPIVLRSGKEPRGTLSVIWPVRSPGQLAAAGARPRASQSAQQAVWAHDLPGYTKSLLRIRLPVSVTLAAKKQPVGKILEMGIGSIIHFDKSCDDSLELEVNGHRVAQGEAVKVGDKFGLRVQSVLLPDERFKPLRPPTLG